MIVYGSKEGRTYTSFNDNLQDAIQIIQTNEFEATEILDARAFNYLQFILDHKTELQKGTLLDFVKRIGDMQEQGKYEK